MAEQQKAFSQKQDQDNAESELAPATHPHTHARAHAHTVPVLQFLAVDTHGPLVALRHTHLMAAALHILTRVLGGVQC